MKRFIVFIFLLVNAYANIKMIDHLNEAFQNIPPNTLIVLDVDGTLIESEDIFDHGECYYFFMSLVKAGYEGIKSQEEKEAYQKIISLVFLEPERYLLEPDIPDLIKTLLAKDIKIIALTSCLNGKFGLINKVEDWRYDQLNEFGIDFRASFEINSFHLNNFPKREYNPPLFDRGILYCYGYPKGDTLKAFLETISYTPEHVIFVDDILSNVENVEDKLDPIPVYGYHYVGSKLPPEKINLDLIRFQYEYLIKHKKWIPDEEAIELLSPALN